MRSLTTLKFTDLATKFQEDDHDPSLPYTRPLLSRRKLASSTFVSSRRQNSSFLWLNGTSKSSSTTHRMLNHLNRIPYQQSSCSCLDTIIDGELYDIPRWPNSFSTNSNCQKLFFDMNSDINIGTHPSPRNFLLLLPFGTRQPISKPFFSIGST